MTDFDAQIVEIDRRVVDLRQHGDALADDVVACTARYASTFWAAETRRYVEADLSRTESVQNSLPRLKADLAQLQSDASAIIRPLIKPALMHALDDDAILAMCPDGSTSRDWGVSLPDRRWDEPVRLALGRIEEPLRTSGLLQDDHFRGGQYRYGITEPKEFQQSKNEYDDLVKELIVALRERASILVAKSKSLAAKLWDEA